jgi:hypothetical protein
VASWPHRICIWIPRERTSSTGGEGGCGVPSGAGEIEGRRWQQIAGRQRAAAGRRRADERGRRGGEGSGLGYGARGEKIVGTKAIGKRRCRPYI